MLSNRPALLRKLLGIESMSKKELRAHITEVQNRFGLRAPRSRSIAKSARNPSFLRSVQARLEAVTLLMLAQQADITQAAMRGSLEYVAVLVEIFEIYRLQHATVNANAQPPMIRFEGFVELLDAISTGVLMARVCPECSSQYIYRPVEPGSLSLPRAHASNKCPVCQIVASHYIDVDATESTAEQATEQAAKAGKKASTRQARTA